MTTNPIVDALRSAERPSKNFVVKYYGHDTDVLDAIMDAYWVRGSSFQVIADAMNSAQEDSSKHLKPHSISTFTRDFREKWMERAGVTVRTTDYGDVYSYAETAEEEPQGHDSVIKMRAS